MGAGIDETGSSWDGPQVHPTGGGSINYTMIFESSAWLAQHLGHNQAYWDTRKQELAKLFNRTDPTDEPSCVATHVKKKLEGQGFALNDAHTGHIPVYCDGKSHQIHRFPPQFNAFGQRVASGVSLVDWFDDDRLDFMTRHRVLKLHLTATEEEKQHCHAITVLDLENEETLTYSLGEKTKIILCAGAATPQLLYEHRLQLSNRAIGEHVNYHILLPFGIYLLDSDLQVTLKDQYVALFATTEIVPEANNTEAATVCNFDFFAGRLDVLLHLISHLFLAFWVPNGIKRWMIKSPILFTFLKRTSRLLVSLFNYLNHLLWSIAHLDRMGKHRPHLISAVVKFNIAREGYYTPAANRKLSTNTHQSSYEIILRCFEDGASNKGRDFSLAQITISKQLAVVASLGAKPHPVFRFLIRLFTKLPYDTDHVEPYIRHYSRNNLLTQQHLSGGCIFGKALDSGEGAPEDTGKVLGSENIYVADLSAAPLPRVSPQMTAYLIGHHVATQLCQGASPDTGTRQV